MSDVSPLPGTISDRTCDDTKPWVPDMLSHTQLQQANALRVALSDKCASISQDRTQILELMLLSFVAGGHVLIDDQPGTGKTFIAKLFSRAFALIFRRLQMTVDLMPMDIVGWEGVSTEREYEYQPGPVFCNFLLADQLNYSTPKTQSALFEVMEEGQVTVKGVTYEQLRPFMVCATQSPITSDHSGYALVPNQLDRFLIRISVGYPSLESEVSYLLSDSDVDDALFDKPLATAQDLLRIQSLARQVRLDRTEALLIATLANATRENDPYSRQYVRFGLSLRASIGLKRACQARALLYGRDAVSRDDVRTLAPIVLAHRLILNFEAQAEGISESEVMKQICERVLS